MTDREKINALAAAVAGLMRHAEIEECRLGEDGYILSVDDGCVCLDGEVLVSDVTPADVTAVIER